MRNSSRFLFALLLLSLASCTREPIAVDAPSDTHTAIQVPSDYVPGVVRVKFKHEPAETKAGGLDLSALENYTMTRVFPPAGKWEARHRAWGLHLWYDIHFDAEMPLSKAGEAVAALEDVDVVEFIPRIKLADAPRVFFNDPRLTEQWHYYNDGSWSNSVAGCDVNVTPAWAIETGNPDVIVGVVDEGVDYRHEDLKRNMWINEAEKNGKDGVDDDNNGYVDDIYGYNFVSYDGVSLVGNIVIGDHGTHVAGTIAAVNNNGIGVSGIAGGNGSPNSGVRILSAQMNEDDKFPAASGAAIVYAADNGAVLINCSWGHDNAESTSASVLEALKYFNANAGMDENGVQVGPMAGGLAIFAAGNDNATKAYPASEDIVLAVAALGADYKRAYYSNYGPWVDICAPGGDYKKEREILSTVPNNGYDFFQGTSMAAPHVTGVAALLVSHYGVGRKGFTREKLIQLLLDTANPKPLEVNKSYKTDLGAGLVDAYAALTAETLDDRAPDPVTGFQANAESNQIAVTWEVPSGDGAACYNFYVFYSTSSLASLDPLRPGKDVKSVRVPAIGKTPGQEVSVTLSELQFSTDYHIRICSESLAGVLSELCAEQVVRTGVNAKPVITPQDGTSLTLPAHGSGSLRFAVSDPDGHALSLNVSDGDGLTASWENGILTLNVNALNAKDDKTYQGVITASDGYDETTLEFSYTILKNHPPVVLKSFGDQIYSSTSEVRTFDLSEYFQDTDTEELTYTARLLTTNIIAKVSVSGSVLTVTGNSFGQTSVEVTATDARKTEVTQSFRVLVRDASRTYDLYPNPVQKDLYIGVGEARTADVTVVNKVGAAVFSQEAVSLDPFAPYAVDMSDQPAGTYYVLIGDDRYTIVKK